MNKEGWDYIEAMEWIDYNTLRAIPYVNGDAPIIMYNHEEFLKEYEVEVDE